MPAAKLGAFIAAILLGASSTAAAAVDDPRRCTLLVDVVTADGTPVPHARLELIGAAASVDVTGTTACVQAGAGTTDIVVVTAEGYQPYASEPLALTQDATQHLVVTLTRPFAEAVTVEGRSTSLVGISASASEGAIGVAELAARPLVKAGDILEVVPGVAMTQHSSGGHAPIILLRGYNLDHGTDFATFLEGVPMNLPSHAHGQGYTDLNFLIPELVERVDFQKGPYAARVGNFGTAGSTNIELVDTVRQPFGRVEGGGNGYYRMVGATSVVRGGRRLLLGAEASHDDGPNVVPDDHGRIKAVARFTTGTPARGLSLTFSGHRADWTASDGYPRRAAERGYISRFGTLDASDGGRSQQHVLVATHRATSSRAFSNAGAYVRYYDFDLYSNNTFWTVSPASGDQIHQQDRRIAIGGHASQARGFASPVGRIEVTVGAQVRHDVTRVGLQNTVRREPRAKVDAAGFVLPARVYDTRIGESSVSAFAESRLHPRPWLRLVAGVRADGVRMDVRADRTQNSGVERAAIVSPKGSIALGPWKRTEIYVNAGRGFHTNHAAGVVQRVDPVTGSAFRRDGSEVVPTPALVPTRGAEVGLRLQPASFAQTSLALWFIGSDSELLYTPEDGFTSPERPGRRMGVEWLNYLQLRRWLAVDLDAAWSSARYRIDPLNEGRAITDTASAVITGGFHVTQPRASVSLRGRYIGRRPLLPDESVVLEGALVTNGQAELQLSRRLRLTMQGFNLLNRRYEDTAYFFGTRLREPGAGQLEPTIVDDFVTRPGQPRVFRLGLRVAF